MSYHCRLHRVVCTFDLKTVTFTFFDYGQFTPLLHDLFRSGAVLTLSRPCRILAPILDLFLFCTVFLKAWKYHGYTCIK